MSTSSSPAFEAIVLRPSPAGGYHLNGTQVPIIAWLAASAAALDASRYVELQNAYNGDLEIVHSKGRVLIEHHATVCSRAGAIKETRKLAENITAHLGLIATVQ